MWHQNGIVAFAGLSAFLLSGTTTPIQCTGGHIGPTNGQVIGAIVGVGAGVALGTIAIVEVNKSHHRIKGCVTAGPDGILVHNDGDQKVYALTGVTANVKVGDIVKVNGDKNKKQKDSAGDVDFMVIKISKDYGPCKPLEAPTAALPIHSLGQ